MLDFFNSELSSGLPMQCTPHFLVPQVVDEWVESRSDHSVHDCNYPVLVQGLPGGRTDKDEENRSVENSDNHDVRGAGGQGFVQHAAGMGLEEEMGDDVEIGKK